MSRKNVKGFPLRKVLTNPKAADQLIAALKSQLATQTELAKEGQRVKKQLDSSESEVAATQTQLEEATTSLTEAQAEIKTLKTKLAAARTAEAAQVKVPSSAIKGNTANSRLLANAEAAAQVAQLKEDLYADMTGLIITGVKREEDGEVYDCLQTGRNGSKSSLWTIFQGPILTRIYSSSL